MYLQNAFAWTPGGAESFRPKNGLGCDITTGFAPQKTLKMLLKKKSLEHTSA